MLGLKREKKEKKQQISKLHFLVPWIPINSCFFNIFTERITEKKKIQL